MQRCHLITWICLIDLCMIASTVNLDGKQVVGCIEYPSYFPTALPKGSCLVIDLRIITFSGTRTLPLSEQIIYNPDKDVTGNYTLTMPDYEFELPRYSPGLSITGAVNVGWCSLGGSNVRWYAEGDFITSDMHIVGIDDIVNSKTNDLQGPCIEFV